MKTLVLFVFSCLLLCCLPALGADGGSVTIPLNEYERLSRTPPSKVEEAAPPADFYIPRAHYRLRCENERTLLVGAVEILVLKKGWVRVPLIDADQPLFGSRLDGAPADLVCQDKSYCLFIQGPGSHKVELEITRDSLLKSPLLNIEIPLTTIPTIDVESLLPGMEVSLSKATLTGQEISPKASVSHYVLPHEGTLTIAAHPRTRRDQRSSRPEINGDLHHVLTLGEALLTCTTAVHLQIPGSKVHDVALHIPDGYEVAGAEGKHLVDHQKNGGTLRLFFDTPLEGDYTCTVKLEKKLRGVSDHFTFTPPALLSAHRQKGYIALAARTNVEIKASHPLRTSSLDIAELPADMASMVPYPLLSGFKYLAPDCSLEVEVKRYQDIPVLVATVDREEVRTLKTQEGLLVTTAAFHVRNNSKQFMTISLPEGAEVWGVFVAGSASKPGKDEKGRILIPLERSVSQGKELGAFCVEVIYAQKGSKLSIAGAPRLNLPSIDMPVSTLSFEILLPEEAFVVRSGGMKRIGSFHFSADDTLNYLSPANYMRARAQGQLTACRSNLKNIGNAMEMYAPETTEALVAGMLPVRISVPVSGKSCIFEQVMVTSGSPAVRLYYISHSIAMAMTLLLSALLFVLLYGVFAQAKVRVPGGMILYQPHAEEIKAAGITVPGFVTLGTAGLTALLCPKALIIWGAAAMLALMAAAFTARRKGGKLREVHGEA